MAPVPWTGPLVPPQGLDVTIPNVARIYDWLLGGKDNFAADREAGQRLLAAVPDAAKAARANRAFLGRAVRFLAEEAGIRQFLDIGTGLPTQGNVHEIAQATDPRARVVYCDNDPIVVTHANALLANNLTVAASQADLRDPDFLFTLPLAHPLLDTSQPMAVLLVAVLHFLSDSDDPWALVERIKRKLAPGSYVVISHVTGDEMPAESARAAAEVYQGASAPGVARSREEIARFFTGLDLVEPGLVEVSAWRPPPLDHRPRPAVLYAGIGRKPCPPPATSWPYTCRVTCAETSERCPTGRGARLLDRLVRAGTAWWEHTGESAGCKGAPAMTTYVSLINWTDQGIKNYRDTTQRAADFTKLAESNGGHVRELLWTVGEYDMVCVVDFPDEETGVAALLQVGSAGNIRSKTMRAFNSEEMAGIIRRTG